MIVELTQGFQAEIDDSDRELVAAFRWKVLKAGSKRYAARSRRSETGRVDETILMHRVICAAPEGVLVDHKDGNGLNNRRSNLRLATQQQNAVNSKHEKGRSGFRGVYWNKEKGLWQAQISGKYLGRFENAEDGARAYDAAAWERHREFAVLNFPDEARR